MKAKRIAYKPKWLAARAEAHEQKGRADAAAREINRLQRILAGAGAQAVKVISDGPGPVELPDLTFECVTAFMRANAQYWPTPYWHDLWQNYLWRGRPLVRRSS